MLFKEEILNPTNPCFAVLKAGLFFSNPFSFVRSLSFSRMPLSDKNDSSAGGGKAKDVKKEIKPPILPPTPQQGTYSIILTLLLLLLVTFTGFRDSIIEVYASDDNITMPTSSTEPSRP